MELTDLGAKIQKMANWRETAPPPLSDETVGRMYTEYPGNKPKANEVKKLASHHGKSWDVLIKFLETGKVVSDPGELADLITSTVEACDLAVGRYLEGRTAIFMLGARGSGKSTTGNWIAGTDYEINEDGELQVVNAGEHEGVNEGRRWFRVGDDKHSVTFLPSFQLIPDPLGNGGMVALVDFAGFKDTCGEAVTIAFDIAFRHLVRKAAKAHALMVTAIENTAERGKGLEDNLMKACQLLPTKINKLERNKPMPEGADCSWVIGVTGCHTLFQGIRKRKMLAKMEASVNDMLGEMESVANLCDYMFNEDGTSRTDVGRQGFVRFVLKGSSIPKPATEFSRLTIQSHIEALTSDCLSSSDVEYVGEFFKNKRWMDALRDGFDKKTKISSVFDPESLTPGKVSHDELGVVFEFHREVNDWLRQRVGYFRKQRSRLMEGFLPLEDEDPRIASLVGLCQPRLNSMIVTAGKELCEQEILQTKLTTEQICKVLYQMKGELGRDGASRVAKAQEKLNNTEQKIAESKGYKDSEEMKGKITAATTIIGTTASGGTAIAAASIAISEWGFVTGLVWTEAAIFTTGASVAGTITAFTGVGLAVFVIGGLVYAHHHKQSQKTQQEMQAEEASKASCCSSLETQRNNSSKIEKAFIDSFNQLEELQTETQKVEDAYHAQSAAMVNFSVEASRLLRS